ncbi:ElyC/SanA/YdcF family protein [Streptomyces sp. NPDC004111]|uniref:YdcF family protein n=1 Tax=Streptomyces sp. NPDC004111 TaxID=3364690 RepID=UPI0036B39D06
MFAYALALLFFVLFCYRVRQDPRRFRNAVLLGLSVAFALPALVGTLAGSPSPLVSVPATLALLLCGLGILVLPCLLVANGVTMVRKEGRSLGNLLSLLAGLTAFGLIALLVVAVRTESWLLTAFAVVALSVAAYVSFLFLCFVGYGFLYGRQKVREDLDYVVVLGSGLLGGRRVSPLLASRLDRGRAVYDAQAERGGTAPVLVLSGGQGPDEEIPEAHAMADYLAERGVPGESLVREDKSRTTEENLRFSRAIMEEAKPDYRCLIVTNNFHAFRAAMFARGQGVRGQVVGSPTARYFWPSATLREFVAVFVHYGKVNFSVCGALVALGTLAVLASR